MIVFLNFVMWIVLYTISPRDVRQINRVEMYSITFVILLIYIFLLISNEFISVKLFA